MKPHKNGRTKLKPPAEVASRTDGFPAEAKARQIHYVSLLIVCLAIIGFWIWNAEPNGLNYLDSGPDKAYYNLLIQGFQSGQLNLKTEVPAGLAQSPDPYSLGGKLLFEWDDGHRLLDLSYYHGKLYLYFGVTPALVLFWPYAAVTGHYLPQKDAGLIFCVVGFLAGVGLLYSLWRRCFAEVNFGVVLAGVVALGLASGLPMLLARCQVYEVAISCGFAFVMLALAAVWEALASPQRQGWWLAAGSLAYGLALGARPDLLFGAGILLIPVIVAWRGRQRVWGLLVAAVVPIVLIGMGLMLYNELRFGSPLQFGQLYQLGAKHDLIQHFSPRYLWFSFRLYFLEPMRWGHLFPYVREMSIPPMPAGHGAVEFVFSVLTGVPLVWLGLAAPLAWRNRLTAGPALRGLAGAAAWLAVSGGLTLCLYYWVADRYELEFLPALVLLAVVGIYSLERALAGHRWHRMARLGWVLLLFFSVGFSSLYALECRAMASNEVGAALENRGQTDGAIRQYQEAFRYDPYFEEPHYNLGCIFNKQGQVDEAINQFQEAVRLKPDYVEARDDLGVDLVKKSQVDEGISQFQEVLRLDPDYVDAHYNLGLAFGQLNRMDEAIGQYQEALRLKPNYAEAHNDLGAAFMKRGQMDEAMSQFQEAIRLKPGLVQAHNNLGIAYGNQDQNNEAAEQFREAVRLGPVDPEAHNNLGVSLLHTGQTDQAISQLQEALRLKPDYADAHYNLGLAFGQQGRMDEAVSQFQDTIHLDPDFAQAHNDLGFILSKQGRTDEAISQFQEALRIRPDYKMAQENLAEELKIRNAQGTTPAPAPQN